MSVNDFIVNYLGFIWIVIAGAIAWIIHIRTKSKNKND